jgi:CheY-like chemotaxis protein
MFDSPARGRRPREEAVMAKKILVIDDEAHIRKYLTSVLEDNGYETCAAADGEEGMEILEKERPDLITLDLQMPGDTGTRFYRNMSRSKDFKDLPVIVVSGIPGKHLAVKKPVAIFDKPIDRDRLISVVKETLGE